MTRIDTKADSLSVGLADGDNYYREKRHVSPGAAHLTGDGADAHGQWWWLVAFKGASTSYVEEDKASGTRGREGGCRRGKEMGRVGFG